MTALRLSQSKRWRTPVSAGRIWRRGWLTLKRRRVRRAGQPLQPRRPCRRSSSRLCGRRARCRWACSTGWRPGITSATQHSVQASDICRVPLAAKCHYCSSGALQQRALTSRAVQPAEAATCHPACWLSTASAVSAAKDCRHMCTHSRCSDCNTTAAGRTGGLQEGPRGRSGPPEGPDQGASRPAGSQQGPAGCA